MNLVPLETRLNKTLGCNKLNCLQTNQEPNQITPTGALSSSLVLD